MTRRRRRDSTVYRVYLDPPVHEQRKKLPGNVRQRIKLAIDGLSAEPRPSQSRILDWSKVEDVEVSPPSVELRRLRLDRWRVVYAIDEDWQAVIVLAIRQRPPYDYKDLDKLLAGLSHN